MKRNRGLFWMGSMLMAFAILLMVKFLIPALQSTGLPAVEAVTNINAGSVAISPSVVSEPIPVDISSNAEELADPQDPQKVEDTQTPSTTITGPEGTGRNPRPSAEERGQDPFAEFLPEEPDLPRWFRSLPAKSIFGYEFGDISEAHAINEMAEAGAEWVRRAIWWPDVEPRKGTYNWENMRSIEQEFQLAREKGMRVIVMVRGTPSWAQSAYPYNRPCGRIREDELDAFAEFMVALVDRYSLDPYDVTYWEIWNEPDVDPRLVPSTLQWMGCWGEIDDPYYGGGYYAEMLKVVYPAVKGANPRAQLLVGGLLLDCDPRDVPSHKTECDMSKFFEGILENGGGAYFDGVSFHAYDYNGDGLGEYSNINWHSFSESTGPVVIAKANFLKEVLENYGVSGKYLINTETAVLCNTGRKSVCEANKAIYAVQSYVSAYALGLRANLWYFWMERDAGLVTSDLAPLPAYETYAFANMQLSGARYLEEIEDFLPEVRAHSFEIAYGRLWVLWSTEGGTHQVELPERPLVIYDAYGNELDAAISIEVSPVPLYVKWVVD